jgi:ubiquinone/menaquinone biosynthesis C-methylase UbiE
MPPDATSNAAFYSRARDLYDGIAPGFDRSRGKNAWEPLVEFTRLDEARREIALVPTGGIVVDLGCGNGRNMSFLSREFAARACIGVDISMTLLCAARNVAMQDASQHLIEASMNALPFRAASISTVACIAALHHSPNKHAIRDTLGQVEASLQPGGILILSVWRKWQRRFRGQVLKHMLSFQRHPGLVIVPWKSPGDREKIVHDREYFLLSNREVKQLLRGLVQVITWARLGGPGGGDNLFFLTRNLQA